MFLVAAIKLVPTPAQAEALRETLTTVNAAAAFVSRHAFTTKTFARFALQKATYKSVRSSFGLSAQTTCLVVGKVAAAYKKNKSVEANFRPAGAISYDNRVLQVNPTKRVVSIWTVGGRAKMSFVAGPRQLSMLAGRHAEADLICRNGKFYLHVCIESASPVLASPTDYLGVDFGVANVATDSDGNFYSGRGIKGVRHRHKRLRRKLQKKGTRSAKRRLKKLSGKERRFATWVNHNVSKRLVGTAKRTGRGIALEDLRGIRERIRVKCRSHRNTLHGWAFAQLRSFVEYKATMAGVAVLVVNPSYTSQTCPVCGFISKDNRRTQSEFVCVGCGHAAHADENAAVNIRGAAVSPPNVCGGNTSVQAPRL